MIPFLLIAILMFALLGMLMAYPLLSKRYASAPQNNEAGKQANPDEAQKAANIQIAREKLAQLEQDYQAENLSPEEYKALKYELESALLEDIKFGQEENTEQPMRYDSKLVHAGVFALFIPVVSLLLYQYLGHAEFVSGQPAQAAARQQHAKSPQSINEMIKALIEKLKQNPQDERGWFLLAKTLMATKQYKKAFEVYQKLLQLTGEDADVLVSMADARAMMDGGKVSGAPEKYIQRALKVDPNHISGLWLAGIAASEKKDNQTALSYWYKLYPLLEDKASRQQVAQMIQNVGGSLDKVATAVTTKTVADNSNNKKAAHTDKSVRLAVKINYR